MDFASMLGGLGGGGGAPTSKEFGSSTATTNLYGRDYGAEMRGRYGGEEKTWWIWPAVVGGIALLFTLILITGRR